MTGNDNISDLVLGLGSALNEFDRFADSELGLADAVDLLIALNRHRDGCKFVYEELSRKVSDLMGDDGEFNVGAVKVEKRWSKSRSGWQHDRLSAEVAHRIATLAIDPDTGEVLKSTEEMIQELIMFVAPSYWRVTALKSIGLDADKYCEPGETKASIIVRNAREF